MAKSFATDYWDRQVDLIETGCELISLRKRLHSLRDPGLESELNLLSAMFHSMNAFVEPLFFKPLKALSFPWAPTNRRL